MLSSSPRALTALVRTSYKYSVPNYFFVNRKHSCGIHINYPFKSSRCIKASFYSSENILNVHTTRGFRKKIPHKTGLLIHGNFLLIFHPHKPQIAVAILDL